MNKLLNRRSKTLPVGSNNPTFRPEKCGTGCIVTKKEDLLAVPCKLKFHALQIANIVGLDYADEDEKKDVKDIVKALDESKYRTFKQVARMEDDSLEDLKKNNAKALVESIKVLRDHFQDETLIGKRKSIVLKSITGFVGKFGNTYARLIQDIDFIRTKEFNYLTNAVSNYIQEDKGKMMMVPLVVGGMGTGKSRLVYECLRTYCEMKGKLLDEQFYPSFYDQKEKKLKKIQRRDITYIYKNAAKTAIEVSDYKKEAEENLSWLLFDTFFDGMDKNTYDHNLNDVTIKITENGIKTILLHLDEFSDNVPYVKSLIFGCDILNRDYKLMVVPVLSGYPVNTNALDTTFAKSYFKIGFARIFLSGVNNEKIPLLFESVSTYIVSSMKTQTHDVLNNNETNDASVNEKNLQRWENGDKATFEIVARSFGELPRLFVIAADTYLDLLKLNSSEFLMPEGTKRDVQHVFNSIQSRAQKKFEQHYGIQCWSNVFRKKVKRKEPMEEADKNRDAQISVYNIMVEHIKRLHTLAVVGLEVDVTKPLIDIDERVSNDNHSIHTLYEEGLFSLRMNSSTNERRGVVVIPMFILYHFNTLTNIFISNDYPTKYDSQAVEYIALDSFRNKWNALFYTGVRQISLNNFRQGCRTTVPDNIMVDITCEMQKNSFREQLNNNNWSNIKQSKSLIQCSDRIDVEQPCIYEAFMDQPGFDGIVSVPPYVIISQSKSIGFTDDGKLDKERSGAVKKSTVENWIKAMKPFKQIFVNMNRTCYFDIFTNRQFAARPFELPSDTFICTYDNIEAVVGPYIGFPLSIAREYVEQARLEEQSAKKKVKRPKKKKKKQN